MSENVIPGENVAHFMQTRAREHHIEARDNALGLARGVVVLVEHDPRWATLFAEEAHALQSVFGEKLQGIAHIGSTAIPGLKAKPILDIMIAVSDLEHWEWIKEPLTYLGYTFRRDQRSEQEHILFVKGPEEARTHYLKVTEHTSAFWQEHLLFRDYLIAHPEHRNEYQALKERSVQEYAGNREPYTKAKAAFIKKMLDRAGYDEEIL